MAILAGVRGNLIIIFISSTLMAEGNENFFQAFSGFLYLFVLCIGKLRPLTLRAFTERVESSLLIALLFCVGPISPLCWLSVPMIFTEKIFISLQVLEDNFAGDINLGSYFPSFGIHHAGFYSFY